MLVSRRNLVLGATALPLAYALVSEAEPAKRAGSLSATAKLGGKLRGRIVLPSDSYYETARRGLGSTPVDDKRPSIIVFADGPEDIARALDYAQTNSLEVAVRSGGHDMLGASTCDKGLMIDLALMNRAQVDGQRQIARVETGTRAGTLSAAAQQFGLTGILGDSAEVGVGGLTLGGGVGWLSGVHGATCDNVLSAQVVTADGRILTADAQTNPDLFWAIRGGGGNFGVATEFAYKLHPIGKVLAGSIGFQSDVGETVRFFREFLHDCPDVMSASLRMWLRGKPTIQIGFCWCGDTAGGDQAVRRLRSFSPATFDSIKWQEYGDFIHLSRLPSKNMFVRGGSFDGISDGVIDEFMLVAEQEPPQGCAIALGHNLHGALCRVETASSPFIRHEGGFLWNVTALWDEAQRPEGRAEWVLATYERVRARLGSKQTYLNYLADNSEAVVRDAFGTNFTRLQNIKRKYDPANLFHGNRNIRVQSAPA